MIKSIAYVAMVLGGSAYLLTARANACELELMRTKAGNKTAYTVAGDSISGSMQAKLSKVCRIRIGVMTPRQLRTHKIKRLKSRLAKLSNDKSL